MRREEERARRPESFNWTLWLKWILATTVGWLIAFMLGNEVAFGAVVGTVQWVVLRPLIRQAAWWIPASAAGWAAGIALVSWLLSPINPIAAHAVIGTGMGLAQWLVLRWQMRRAWWWIVLSALGWTVGMMAILGSLLEGAVAGAVTGFALELLLRYQRPLAPGRDTTE